MRITGTGNVGIGTNNPTQKLDVRGIISNDNHVIVGDQLQLTNSTTFLANISNEIAFYTSTTEQMRIDASGNVGIGTNNPVYKLDIPSSTDNETIAILGQLRIRNKGIDNGGMMNDNFNTDNAGFWQNNGGLCGIGAPDNDIVFYSGTDAGSEIARIQSAGLKVGSGNADYPFHTQKFGGNSLAVMGYFKNATGGTGAGTQIRIDSNNPDKGLELTQTSTTYSTSLPYKQDSSTIRALNDELILATNDIITGTIRLITGNGTQADKTLIFDPSGRVGIGTDTASAKFEVESTSGYLTGRFYRKTTNTGDHVISVNSNITTTKKQHFRVFADGDVENTNGSYGTISDRKFKKDIIDAGSQWEDIKNIRFRKYKFIDGDESEKLGVIAQELQTTSPGLVKTNIDDNDEEYLSVKQSVIFMKGMKALQEALLRIETLEREIEVLKN
jgi:hypothetical protein